MDFLRGRIKGGEVEGKVALWSFRARHFECHRVSDQVQVFRQVGVMAKRGEGERTLAFGLAYISNKSRLDTNQNQKPKTTTLSML